jgi:hypothetical protein
MDKIIHMEALQKQTVILEVLYAISCCVLPTKMIPHRESLKGILYIYIRNCPLKRKKLGVTVQ